MRYSTGYIRKQRGKWIGAFYIEGKRTSKTIGLVKEVTKTEARERLTELIKASRRAGDVTVFGPFVEGPYFDFYSRKWKSSTAENNKQRIRTHLIAEYRERVLSSFKRDELQDLLDAKAKNRSFSVVDHLRWDLKTIFDMAIAEGHIRLNPAALLFTPREAKRPDRKVLSISEVVVVFQTLEWRERLVAKMAILAGMRPGEIFGLTWGRIGETFAKVEQRVYRGLIDTPKTRHSVREAAITDRLMTGLEEYREVLGRPGDQTFVFPSERGTALSKDNIWRRNMQPKLKIVGLDWANFQVMRRTHATVMRMLKADPKAVSDQMGHSLDVNQNVYTQTSVEMRLALVNQLESFLIQ